MRFSWSSYVAAPLVFLVLASGYQWKSDQRFNERMNEDINEFLDRYRDADSNEDSAKALSSILLQSKRNTSSYVQSTFAALLFNILFVSIVLGALAVRRKD